MGLINKKGIREEFSKSGFRISNEAIEFIIKLKEESIKKEIALIMREAKLSGRKNIKKEDYAGLVIAG